MVQPRKEQILNLQTRHTRFFLRTPTSGALFDLVLKSVVHGFTVTDVEGGADEDVGPDVLGGLEPYGTVSGGDSFRIVPDGGGAVDVVLAVTDTTASRVAAAINAVSPGLAFAKEGRIRIVSLTTGDDSSLVLSDLVPGTLPKLGLVAATYDGISAPVRGILTRTRNAIAGQTLADYYDRLGGCVVMKTADGRDILTEASGSILLSDSGVFADPDAILRSLEIPGGVPIFARLTAPVASPTEYEFRYYARMPMRPEVVTSDSDFVLLDGTDSFDIEVVNLSFAAGPIAMTFPSGPALTRDQVVTRINELWAAAVNLDTADGKAFVNCTMTAPYPLSAAGTQMEVSVDGGAFQVTTWSVTENTVAAVVATFNTDIIGATASPATVKGQDVIRFESDNTDGATSSLEFRAPAGGKSEIFRQVGIVPGKYRGIFVAEPHGPGEISIRGFGRGANADIRITGSAATLIRMGLTAATFVGDEEGEESVQYPSLAVGDPLLVDDEPAALLIPEVMEYGEVPRETNSTTNKFGDRSPGPSLVPSQQLLFHDCDQLAGRGGAEAGRPITYDAAGFLPASLVDVIRPDYENFFKQFIRGDFVARTVTALVTRIIETPGTDGNPGATSPHIRVDIDPDDNHTGDDRGLEVRFGRDGGSAHTPFIVRNLPTPIEGVKTTVNLFKDITSGDLTAIRGVSGALLFFDKNTEDAAVSTSGKAIVPLTSGVSNEGDRTLRILEVEEGNTEPVSIIRQVNGRWTATCGDGTTSFGDFNGPNAIQQAITYYLANLALNSTLHLQLKSGTYEVNAANGAIDGIAQLSLEGLGHKGSGSAGATIVRTDATDPMFDVDNLVLKNLKIRTSTGGACEILISGNAAEFYAEDVHFDEAYLHFRNGIRVAADRCFFDNGSMQGLNACLLIEEEFGGAEQEGFTFRNCKFETGFGQAVLRITHKDAGTAITLERVAPILFSDCVMDLNTSNVVNTGFNPGLVELDPNGNDARGGGGKGVHVDSIEFKNCRVRANVTSGVISQLIWITGAAWGQDTVDDFISLGRLTIDGGLWTCPAVDSTYNPVTICGVGETTFDGSLSIPTKDRGGVHIRNWRVGWDETANHTSFDYGGGVAKSFRRLLDDTAPPSFGVQEFWGAVVIEGPIIRIRDIEVVNPVQMSRAGEFLFRWRELDIDGIDITYKAQVGGGLNPEPRHRFRYRPRADAIAATDLGAYATVKNVRLTGEQATVASSQWMDGTFGTFHHLEPWGSINADSVFTFDSCTITGFADAGATRFDGYGIFIDWRVANNVWAGSPAEASNFTVKNCTILDGFRGIHSASGDATEIIGVIRIINNVLKGHENTGLFINGGVSLTAWKEVHVRDNSVTDCGDPGIVGVSISGAGWGFRMPLIFVNNFVGGNNTNDTDDQVQFQAGGTAIANLTPNIACHGNTCRTALGRGNIRVNRTDGGGNLVALDSLSASSVATSMNLSGFETGHSTTSIRQREHANGITMLMNVADLATP